MPDINELKKQKADLAAEAKRIRAEIDAEDSDLNPEQIQARESKVDDLLKQAEEKQAKVKAEEERRERARAQSRQISAFFEAEAEPEPSGGDPNAGSQPGPIGKVGDPEWTKDPNKGFEKPREFFGLVMHATQTGRVEDERLQYLAAAGTDEQQVTSDPYGGFLVPEGMSPDLMSVMPEDDPFAGRTTPLPMDSPTVHVNARVDKDHSSSVSGGLTVTRRAETVEGSSSRMKTEQITLHANGLFGLAYATEELLNDSPRSIAALLESGFRDEFQSNHVKELLRGTGVGEPEGIQNNPALITVAKESAQTADTIVGENLIKMRARAWRYARSFWLANHDTLPQLMQAHLAGTNGDVFLFQPGRGIDSPDTLLGRPIFFTEYAETLGDKNDIMLVDPSQVLEGTLQPLQSAESIHVRFERNERTFRFTMRNDARGWWRAPLTPNKSSNTLSPFVTLAARA